MTQSVTEKTSIPEKTWRRQHDSPTWWITFVCGSVILHLLAFWLISLYKFNSSPEGRGSSAVPIEFIEISPQKSSPVQPKPKPKPKPVSPKPAPKAIVPQNSQPTTLPSVVKPPISTSDRNAIAFNNQKIEQQRQQQQQKLAEQQLQLEAEQLKRQAQRQQQREQQLAQQKLERQQQREQQLAQQKLERQQQREEQLAQQKLERQQQLEEQLAQQKLERQQQLEEQQLSQNPADGEKITDALTNQVGQAAKEPKINSQTPESPVKINQNEEIPLNQSARTQLNQSSGILTASWDIDFNTPITRDIPANPPQPKENISKSFVIPASEENNVQPTDFQVYLNIDEEGNVKPLVVDETISPQQRQQYQKYVDKEFLNKKLFYPATDPDPRTGELKPRRGELFIRIKIQQGS
jgi:colicin import membrane protein